MTCARDMRTEILPGAVWNAERVSAMLVFLQGTSVQPFGYGKHGSRWVVRLETQNSSEPEKHESLDKIDFSKLKGMILSYLEFLCGYMWQCLGQWWQCSPFFSGKSVARPWRFLPLALAESAQRPWRQRQLSAMATVPVNPKPFLNDLTGGLLCGVMAKFM